MATPSKPARVPPRWFVVTAWHAHRAIHRLTGGRRGLWRYTPGGRWGALVLHSTGRRSGKVRSAILGYVEDGENLAVLAMNGWGQPEPAWWLNLQAHPDAIVELKGGERRAVRARAAVGEDRERLLRRLDEAEGDADLNAYLALRSRETAVVVLEPR
jgi:deazaflavin-dependent oxidoreductase (nitroreductase family)